MGRRGLTRAILRVFFICFLFLPFPAHAETDYKLIKSEITGINEKTLQVETQESLSVGDKLALVRGGETVAVCEVVKIKDGTVTVGILEQYMEPDFDDTIMKVVEVKPPVEEKPKEVMPEAKPETKTEVKPEETKPAETVKPETPVTPTETKNIETHEGAPMPKSDTNETNEDAEQSEILKTATNLYEEGKYEDALVGLVKILAVTPNNIKAITLAFSVHVDWANKSEGDKQKAYHYKEAKNYAKKLIGLCI